ncbi:MAG: hypothetical protein GX957_07950, partial [Clostridiaceae bacterium]|nr:hypothetical protein [Clostridiaceae bacterium]
INIIGTGDSTVLTKGSKQWTNSTGSKGYASIITIVNVEGEVKLENIKVTGATHIDMTGPVSGTDYGSGINVVSSSNVTLNNVTSTDNDGAGLIVNSSTVTATNLKTSGNGWYGVNVDKADSGAAIFTLNSGELSEDIQIKSDKSVEVTVNALGYIPYKIEGTTETIWSNRGLRNVAIITKDEETKYYRTIQAAIDAANPSDTILVAPGEYDVTYVNESDKHYLLINKPVTIKAADIKNKPILTADYSKVNSQAGNQQQTVHILADNVTLDGLVIYSIKNYPTDWIKVVEITNANNVTVKNCEIQGAEGVTEGATTAIYLGGTGIGKYTIEDNLLDGAIVLANGAGNGEDGDQASISGNTINASISFTGKTNSGWDHNHMENYPTISDNTINGTANNMLINSRDSEKDMLISDDTLEYIMKNNYFPDGKIGIVSDKYEYFNSTLYRKRLMLNPPVYNESQNTYHMTIQDAIDAVKDLETPNSPTNFTISVMPGTYNEDIEIIQQENKNIILQAYNDGNKYADVTLTGTIKINGNLRSDGNETITIRGFVFDHSNKNEGVNIIGYSNLGYGHDNTYPHNITIEDCDFIGNEAKTTVAVSVKQGKSYIIRNYKGDSLHSLGQFYSTNNITIENCSISGGKSGFNFNQSTVETDIYITNLVFNGNGYGVRIGTGNSSPAPTKITIENSSIVSSAICEEENLNDPDTAIVLRGGAPKTIVISNSTIKNSNVDSYDIANTVADNKSAYTFEFTDVDFGEDGKNLGQLSDAIEE